MNPHEPSPPEPDADLLPQQRVAARRAALVKGLRAGGIAVGGGASLNAFAARVATSNGTQCTVSGQASAAISNPANASTAPCAGFKPSSLFKQSPYVAKRADAYTTTVAGSAVKLQVTKMFVAVQLNGSSSVDGIQLKAFNWPSALPGVTNLAKAEVQHVFEGTDATPLLYALYRNDNLSFFIAAYLSTELTRAPANSTHLPFNAADVVKYYNGGDLDAKALNLYRLVCVG